MGRGPARKPQHRPNSALARPGSYPRDRRLALAATRHPHGDPGYRRGRSGAVTARPEPHPPASGGGAVEMTATWTCPATRCPRPSTSCHSCRSLRLHSACTPAPLVAAPLTRLAPASGGQTDGTAEHTKAEEVEPDPRRSPDAVRKRRSVVRRKHVLGGIESPATHVVVVAGPVSRRDWWQVAADKAAISEAVLFGVIADLPLVSFAMCSLSIFRITGRVVLFSSASNSTPISE